MKAKKLIPTPPPKKNLLYHSRLPATDPSKVARFYEQLFGWKFNKWEGANMDYWLISHKDAQSADDTLGGLYKRNMPQEGFLNYFNVKSIDDSIKSATNLGASVIMAKQEIPNIGYSAVLKDPDGNTFALFQSAGRM